MLQLVTCELKVTPVPAQIGFALGDMLIVVCENDLFITITKTKAISNFRGGFEFSLSYIFTQDANANLMKQTLCPKGNSQLRWFGY